MIKRKRVESIDISKPIQVTSDNLNRILVTLRRNKGYTQEALAIDLGMSTVCINEWEHAKTVPRFYLLLDVLDFYGYKLEIKKK